jgi:hypothetical protein
VKRRGSNTEWNGRDLGWPRARETFEALNGLGTRATLDHNDAVKGRDVARDVGDVATAAAWMLNRGDVGALAEIAKLSRRWLAKAHPLFSEHSKVETISEKRGVSIAAPTIGTGRVVDLGGSSFGQRGVDGAVGAAGLA